MMTIEHMKNEARSLRLTLTASMLLAMMVSQAAHAQKSANDCDKEIPGDIIGKRRQSHIENCLLKSLGQPPLSPELLEKPLKIYPNPRDWEYVTLSDGGVSVYISTKSNRDSKSKVKAWTLDTSEDSLNGTDEKDQYQSRKSLNGFDCDQRRIGLISTITYRDQAGSGKVVYSIELQPNEVKYKHVVPGSIGEAILDAVCSKKGK